MPKKKSWKSYEEVATHLLNRFAEHFGLKCVEGKQCVPGKSGTDWEIDAKGVAKNGEGFFVVECKHRKGRLNQAILGSLAYSIQDTGAQGGIVVTPIDLQVGAKKVAAQENIHHVKLSPESTTTVYLLRWLKGIFTGLPPATCGMKAGLTLRVFQNDGQLVQEIKV